MFSEVVLVEDAGGEGGDPGGEALRQKRHFRKGLQRDAVLHRLRRRLPPRERTVTGHERAGEGLRVEVLEALHDDAAGAALVVASHFVRREEPRAGHVAMEVVGVRRPVAGDGAAGLGECGGVSGMRVDDAADRWKRPVERQVGREVGGRPQPPLEHGAILQRDDDDVLGLHRVVGDAAGLDGHEAARAVDARDVAPRQRDEAMPREREVGLEDGLLERGVHGRPPSGTRRRSSAARS